MLEVIENASDIAHARNTTCTLKTMSNGSVAPSPVTRFKGLGEISPNEFKQFIGKEMRLRCFRTGKVPLRRVFAHVEGEDLVTEEE